MIPVTSSSYSKVNCAVLYFSEFDVWKFRNQDSSKVVLLKSSSSTEYLSILCSLVIPGGCSRSVSSSPPPMKKSCIVSLNSSAIVDVLESRCCVCFVHCLCRFLFVVLANHLYLFVK